MLSVHGRKPAAVVVVPVAKLFLKMGLTPNVVTVVGTIVTIAISAILIPLDHLFAAAILSGLFSAFDMLDGTMARLTTGGSKFGATLDASCDRITDAHDGPPLAYFLSRCLRRRRSTSAFHCGCSMCQSSGCSRIFMAKPSAIRWHVSCSVVTSISGLTESPQPSPSK